jgi:hypothetical protein
VLFPVSDMIAALVFYERCVGVTLLFRHRRALRGARGGKSVKLSLLGARERDRSRGVAPAFKPTGLPEFARLPLSRIDLSRPHGRDDHHNNENKQEVPELQAT